MFDVIIRGGEVIDGARSRRFPADVGIRGDRIAAIGDLARGEAGRVIDAAGKIVAPGFIDVHNHSDGWLLRTPHLTPKTLQGFTTEVLAADGISYAPVDEHTATDWLFYLRPLDGLRLEDYRGWRTLREYLDCIAGRNVQNVAAHVPYANVRALSCGFGPAGPDDFQVRQIQADIRRAMDEGAVGLSTGLDYIVQFRATTEELVAACRPVADAGGLYATHVRYKLGLLPALEEAVEIGRRSGVRVHISHLKAVGPTPADEVLGYIDRARRDVDLSFDVYPYQPGSSMLSYLLPYEAWDDGPLGVLAKLRDPIIRRRFARGLAEHRLNLDHIRIAWVSSQENAAHHGRRLSDYARKIGRPPEEALLNLLIEERLAVLLVFDEGDDRRVRPFLQHDLYMMGTDGIYADSGPIHPRMYGSAGRLLGPLVRDEKLFSLEDAVWKLSSHAAERFRLKDRGVLRDGAFADVVVFDAATVTDRATYAEPRQTTIGIEHVLVNGEAIIADAAPVEALTEPLPGRALA